MWFLFDLEFFADEPTINQTNCNVVDGIDLDEIKEFAKAFKLRRLSLGLTQTQVGQALSVTEGPAYSQSAICRFVFFPIHNSKLMKFTEISWDFKELWKFTEIPNCKLLEVYRIALIVIFNNKYTWFSNFARFSHSFTEYTILDAISLKYETLTISEEVQQSSAMI